MLDDMHQHIIQAHIGIHVFHMVAFLLDKSTVSFNRRRHRLELEVHDGPAMAGPYLRSIASWIGCLFADDDRDDAVVFIGLSVDFL